MIQGPAICAVGSAMLAPEIQDFIDRNCGEVYRTSARSSSINCPRKGFKRGTSRLFKSPSRPADCWATGNKSTPTILGAVARRNCTYVLVTSSSTRAVGLAVMAECCLRSRRAEEEAESCDRLPDESPADAIFLAPFEDPTVLLWPHSRLEGVHSTS